MYNNVILFSLLSAIHKHVLLTYAYVIFDLCGLVVRVPGYRSRGPGPILDDTVFSEKSRIRPWGSIVLTTRHPSIRKSWH
jgi:hypothetical protein